MTLRGRLPRFVSAQEVPLPLDYVQEQIERSRRRWVAFSQEGVLCESDDVWSLLRWVRSQDLEVWVTLARLN